MSLIAISDRKKKNTTGPLRRPKNIDLLVEGLESQERVMSEVDRMVGVRQTILKYGLSAPILTVIDTDGSVCNFLGLKNPQAFDALSKEGQTLCSDRLVGMIDSFCGQEGWKESIHFASGKSSTPILGGMFGAAGGFMGAISILRDKVAGKGDHLTMAAGVVGGAIAGAIALKGGMWAADKFLNSGKVYGSYSEVKDVTKDFMKISEIALSLMQIKFPDHSSFVTERDREDMNHSSSHLFDESGDALHHHTSALDTSTERHRSSSYNSVDVDRYMTELREHCVELSRYGVDTGAIPHFHGKSTPYKMVDASSSGWNEHTISEAAQEFSRAAQHACDEIYTRASHLFDDLTDIEEESSGGIMRCASQMNSVMVRVVRHLTYLDNDTRRVFSDLHRFYKK